MWIVKMNMPLILMSLVGAGMIVIVILLKKGFGRFLPQRLFPLLWICVLIRLLIPFSISSPLNLTSFSKWGNWAEFRTFGRPILDITFIRSKLSFMAGYSC